jgi:hypothetical protein
VLPGCGLLLTPLFSKRLCATPLAEALLRPGRVAPGRTGYLSMDQARSLLPLEPEDEAVGGGLRTGGGAAVCRSVAQGQLLAVGFAGAPAKPLAPTCCERHSRH